MLQRFDEKTLTLRTSDAVFSLATLESKLVEYVNDKSALAQPFDISSIPKVSRAQAQQEAARKHQCCKLLITISLPYPPGPTALETIDASTMPKASTSAAPPPPTAAETQSTYASQLTSVPEFESYGPVLNSSTKLLPLTESETEYFVTCVKHIFKEHIVFQFNVTNTLPESVLEGVSVLMQPAGEGLTEDFIIPIPSLAATDGPQIVYVSFSRDSPDEYFVGGFGCTLKFVSKEIDPDTGMPEETGYEDEYHVEDIEVTAGGDYILPSYCSFNAEWDGLAKAAEIEEVFTLGAMASIKGGCSFSRPLSEDYAIGRCSLADILYSRMRIAGGDPEHGGDWGHREPELKCGAHAAAVWTSERGWGQGTCKVSDGVHGEQWRLTSDAGAGRKRKGSESGHRDDWIGSVSRMYGGDSWYRIAGVSGIACWQRNPIWGFRFVRFVHIVHIVHLRTHHGNVQWVTAGVPGLSVDSLWTVCAV